MRKIIVYIATSADGYIARGDGSVDWLNRPHVSNEDYGMTAFMKQIDAVLWGSTTFDVGRRLAGGKKRTRGFGGKTRNYVFTTRPPQEQIPGVEFVSEPVKAFATRLRAAAGKDVWMIGGGKIIASFLDAGEIDEFIIHTIPVFIGEGIPLIARRHSSVPLRLKASHQYPDGVVKLHYAVAGRE